MRVAFCLYLCLTLIPNAAKACSVDVDAVSFGTVDLSTSNTSSGTISVACPAAASFSLAIRSQNVGADRVMTGPSGAQLRYRLYVDSNFIQEWGDGGVTGAAVGSSLPANGAAEFTVYGRVPPQSTVPNGSYTDLSVVTLLF